MSHSKLDYLHTLHQAGYRNTAQRQTVLDAVCNAGSHAPIGAIIQEARQLDPKLDQSTVYRALSLFVELGLVLSGMDENGERIYEIAGEQPHHHLVCRKCGATTTIAAEISELFFNELAAAHGYRVDMDHLIVYGGCPACRER